MIGADLRARAALFDLDGVLVDTAEYHYRAWKEIGNALGIDISPADNERLKGVSRSRCMDIILEMGDLSLSPEEREAWAAKKNDIYRGYIGAIGESSLLEGALDYLKALSARRIPIALGSASKNAGMVLDRTGIRPFFDAVVDGTLVSRPKPDPEVFLKGAELLHIESRYCAVFEDSSAGIDAAKAAGMIAVGIGTRDKLVNADILFPRIGLADFSMF